MSPHTRAFADPAGVAHSQDATTLLEVQSGTEPSHFQIACLDALPRNVPQQPSSLDRLQTVEPTNSMIFAADFSISSEKVGEEQLSPPEVTPSHLREIDHVWRLLLIHLIFLNPLAQRMSMHLLMYFTHWINVHLQNRSDPMTSISVSHGRWIFALLTKVEDQLSADEMNLLRNLARACLGLIQRYRGNHAKGSAAPAGISDLTLMENATNMSEASCWMIFAAVAGHWGQRDLWADAETGLSSC
ncbi:hypothetical protein JVT61DRAFT_13011 [Boletus reticuloceps]|uniref:Uncharacterized protein n=1 Tax=Boletus reticuloceps TaxID=495285 RepID=A0A8I3ACU1_9AGAM|nr:hypothetical protein JVT61DRAFT_13011 [Boletus reticuloceps]